MRRIDVAGVLVFILAGVGATRGRAQTPALVSPSSTLPVTVALQSSAVTLAVSLAQPAVLVPLGYHADRGWYPLTSPAALPLRSGGRQTIRFPRRLGRLEVPTGTTVGSVPDVPEAGLGCAAARGVVSSTTGRCGFAGSESVGPILDVALAPSDYRGALLRLAPGLAPEYLEAALRATQGQPPGEGLALLVASLAARDTSVAWALVRVPRAP